MSRTTLVAALTLLFAACGPIEEQSSAPGADGPSAELLAKVKFPIVGGTVDHGDPEVFMLAMQYSNGEVSGCTGTLIADRTIATAAHCVDPALGQASSVDIWVMNKTFASDTGWIRVVETRMHPGWNPFQSLAHDIAMMRLESAPAAPKKPWNQTSLGNVLGKTVRAVGYGITSKQGNDSGVKRHVELTVREQEAAHLFIGDNATEGICHGDSGGPTFMTFSDGTEKLVAIHSFDANGSCTLGGVIRTDVYASFINQWLSEKEGPQCGNDGECNQACNPVDVDCYCLADNVCDTRCPSLLQDPDCPKDCIANGVCATETCPTRDVDCVDDADTCTSELQCRGRVCTSDPQHPTSYCSRPCTETTECPAGMTCVSDLKVCQYPQLPEAGPNQSCTQGQTMCTQGTVCTGPANQATKCQQPCSSNADCEGRATCENGQGELRYCRLPTPTPVLLPQAKFQEQKVAQGCAAVGGGPVVLLALASMVSTLRRRRSKR